MFNISITAKRLMVSSFVVSIVAFAIGSFFINNILHFALGTVAGAVGTVARVIMLDRSISSAVNMRKESAENYAKLRFMLRYFLAGAIMLFCALLSSSCLFGAILGTVSMQLGAYAVHFLFRSEESYETRGK